MNATPVRAVAAAHAALKSIALMLPHLAGLAYLVRVETDPRVATAGIFASGRMLVDPQWFLALTATERIFVVAHELMHLALRTHERRGDTDPQLFNVAHDFIINDMLRTTLAMPIPAGGLDRRGAAQLSAEALIAALRSLGEPLPDAAWGGRRTEPGALGAALAAALGLQDAEPERRPSQLDVLDEATERLWFPLEDARALDLDRRAIETAADKAVALGVWRERVDRAFTPPTGAPGSGARCFVTALDERTRPPWELALQRWLDDAAPGWRSFARASRRQGERADIVMAGRRREGWTLNVVLDTSGSMVSILGSVLGAIKRFCEATEVRALRLIQCGEVLETDDIVAVEDLDRVEIRGGRNGDLRPGMMRLAQDPDVEAAVIVTDGQEAYPSSPMPYAVLWAITGSLPGWFEPDYGVVITGLAPT